MSNPLSSLMPTGVLGDLPAENGGRKMEIQRPTGTRTLHVSVPVDLHVRWKVVCARIGMPMGLAIVKAVEAYVLKCEAEFEDPPRFIEEPSVTNHKPQIART